MSWGGSWGTIWGSSWGSSAGAEACGTFGAVPEAFGSISTAFGSLDLCLSTAYESLGGKPAKRIKGPKAYSAHEQSAKALTDARQASIDRILAERKTAIEAPVTPGAPDKKRKPVLLAGGALVPPVLPPAAITLGEMLPELAELKARLEATGIDFEEDRRRRLLLLSVY